MKLFGALANWLRQQGLGETPVTEGLNKLDRIVNGLPDAPPAKGDSPLDRMFGKPADEADGFAGVLSILRPKPRQPSGRMALEEPAKANK